MWSTDIHHADPDLHQMVSWVREGVVSSGREGPVLPSSKA